MVEEVTGRLRHALVGVVGGDAAALRVLSSVEHSELESIADTVPDLVLERAGVIRVLVDLEGGQIDLAQAHLWASFMRWGHLPGGRGRIRPLAIAYTATDEDAIVEVVARLEELGDVVDGELRPGELQRLLRWMRGEAGVS